MSAASMRSMYFSMGNPLRISSSAPIFPSKNSRRHFGLSGNTSGVCKLITISMAPGIKRLPLLDLFVRKFQLPSIDFAQCGSRQARYHFDRLRGLVGCEMVLTKSDHALRLNRCLLFGDYQSFDRLAPFRMPV